MSSKSGSSGRGAALSDGRGQGVAAASIHNAASYSQSDAGGSSSPIAPGRALCLNHSAGSDIGTIKRLIPALTHTARKGQMGRVGLLGGSADFTGAPFYAGMAGLKVGGDLCYIFTAEEASGPLKAYSPELMVTPVYSAKGLGVGFAGDLEGEEDGCSDAARSAEHKAKEKQVARMVERVTSFFPKLHVLVVGPGLGRDPWIMEATRRILVEAKTHALPLVIDADGLWLVAHSPEILQDYPEGDDGGGVVVTPNLIEFARLQAGLTGASVAEATPPAVPFQHTDVIAVAKALGGKAGRVTVCLKGREDIVADRERWLVVTEEGARRRSGGLGDILAGTTGVLLHWSHLAMQEQAHGGAVKAERSERGSEGKGAQSGKESTCQIDPRDRVLWACAGASLIARRASRRAFEEHRRSMTAPDVLGTSIG